MIPTLVPWGQRVYIYHIKRKGGNFKWLENKLSQAKGSPKPDEIDALSYDWFYYEEAGTRVMSNSGTAVKHDIKNFDQSKASLEVKTNRVMPQ